MATFVLVHGAWHQGWAWEAAEQLLRQLGHRTVAPSLTLTPGTRMRDHVAELSAAVTETAAVSGPVTLVAHSYAGLPAAEVASVTGSVQRLVLLDAWVADPGRSVLDVAPQWFADWCRGIAVGDPAMLPVPASKMLGLAEDGAEWRWLAPKLVEHPMATFTDPVETGLVTERAAGAPLDVHAVIAAPSRMPFRAFAERRGIPVHEIESGHDIMVSAPKELAHALHLIAGDTDVAL